MVNIYSKTRDCMYTSLFSTEKCIEVKNKIRKNDLAFSITSVVASSNQVHTLLSTFRTRQGQPNYLATIFSRDDF